MIRQTFKRAPLFLLLVLSCTPPLLNRAKNDLPPVSCEFHSEDPVVDSIGGQGMEEFLSEGGQRLKITYRHRDDAAKSYRITINAKQPSLVDSGNQAMLFYQIYQITGKHHEKNDSIQEAGKAAALATGIATSTIVYMATGLPFGFFSLANYEIPYAKLDPKDKAKIDSLTPKATINYTISLSHPGKGGSSDP